MTAQATTHDSATPQTRRKTRHRADDTPPLQKSPQVFSFCIDFFRQLCILSSTDVFAVHSRCPQQNRSLTTQHLGASLTHHVTHAFQPYSLAPVVPHTPPSPHRSSPPPMSQKGRKKQPTSSECSECSLSVEIPWCLEGHVVHSGSLGNSAFRPAFRGRRSRPTISSTCSTRTFVAQRPTRPCMAPPLPQIPWQNRRGCPAARSVHRTLSQLHCALRISTSRPTFCATPRSRRKTRARCRTP